MLHTSLSVAGVIDQLGKGLNSMLMPLRSVPSITQGGHWKQTPITLVLERLKIQKYKAILNSISF